MASTQPENTNRRNATWRWLPALAWMGLIFGFSSRADSANQSGWVTHQLFRVMSWPLEPRAFAWWDHVLRKIAHFSLYAILGLLVAAALGAVRRRWVLAWAIATAYAATDEFHQLFVPNRGPSVWDVALDSTGAATALCLAALLVRLCKS